MNRQELIPRSTITMMVTAYKEACQEIEEAYRLLESAQKRLRGTFADTYEWYFKVNPRDTQGVGSDIAKQIVSKTHREAWTVIVEKMALAKMLPIKRRDELETQLKKGDLPPLTETAILDMFEQAGENYSQYLEEKVTEVYDYIRPRRMHGYATNSPSGIGKKHILTNVVELDHVGAFRVSQFWQKWLTALDSVMSGLDGKGVVKSHFGPLSDAIRTCDGQGETDYFKFRCYLNGNLHLEFRRLDLLSEFNRIGGGSAIGCEAK